MSLQPKYLYLEETIPPSSGQRLYLRILLFPFLFHVGAYDTFPLVFDALPDSAKTKPGKGFYDTQHQLLWVCQPLSELYTPSIRLRKVCCIR